MSILPMAAGASAWKRSNPVRRSACQAARAADGVSTAVASAISVALTGAAMPNAGRTSAMVSADGCSISSVLPSSRRLKSAEVMASKRLPARITRSAASHAFVR